MKDTRDTILTDLHSLEKRLDALKTQKQADQLQQITGRLTATAAAMEHDRRSKAYLEFCDSKAYIDTLKNEIEQTGVTATNPVTGTAHKLQLSADGRTGRVFGRLKAGGIYELAGRPHLVTDFSFSPAGSDATLLPLNAKMHLVGRPQTPYSLQPCRFDHGSKTLSVAPQDRLSPGQQIIIDGQKYDLAAQIGVSENCFRYELVEASK